MQITVDKLEVLNDVKREVEYSGAKGGDYDHMRIIDADDELLRRWMSDALKSIENELRAGRSECRNTAGRKEWCAAPCR